MTTHKKDRWKKARTYAHEDTGETREVRLPGGKVGTETQTLCGHWFPVWEDDDQHWEQCWRWSRPDDRPTCPRCIEHAPYDWPGVLLIVVGGLGLSQIVRVDPDDSEEGGHWTLVAGFGRPGDLVAAEGKEVAHVLQEGDYLEDLRRWIRNGTLMEGEQDD